MSILSVFETHCKSVRIDTAFTKQVFNFANLYVNKPEHLKFFGHGLLSTELKWLPADTSRWFSDILQTDEDDLQAALYKLPAINPEHKVASNAFNLSFSWLVHKVLTSNLSQRLKEDTAIKLLSILQYKFISSILNHFFRYGVNRQLAQRTFESMNYKYDLRVYRNWYALCAAKSKNMIARQSIHYQTFIRYNEDDAILYVITDCQTRVRSTIRYATELYYNVYNEGAGISVTSMLSEVEGEIGVRDLKRNESQYRRYLESVIGDSSSFVRQNLVDIVADANPSGNAGYFQDSLHWISNNYYGSYGNKLQVFVKRVLDFSFQLIHDKAINPNNLSAVMLTIKGAINSSRGTSNDVSYLRSEGDKIIRKAIDKKSPFPIAGERTAVILYIVLRAMTMHYYKSNSG